MFRTAVRQFAWTARRAAGTVEKLSVAEIDAAYRHGIEVSQTQGVASRGLVDGTVFITTCSVNLRSSSVSSNRKNTPHSIEETV